MSAAFPLYEQALARRQQLYDATVNAGKVTPFIYPWDTVPALYLFLAIVLSPRVPGRLSRTINISTLILMISHAAYIFTQRRTIGMAGGYGMGLSLTWGCIISAVILLVNDGPTRFARLERRDYNPRESGVEHTAHSVASLFDGDPALRNRRVNGGAKMGTSKESAKHTSAADSYQLVWQAFPDGLRHRTDWALDLMTSFRGSNWNFRIPTMPPIDAPRLKDTSIELSYKIKTTDSVVLSANEVSPEDFNFRSVLNTALLYLFLDTLKALMVTDPYFLGLAPITSVSPWSAVQTISRMTYLPQSFLTRFIRLIVTVPAVVGALSLIFSLSPLFFYYILPLVVDPKKFTYAPLMEQSMYPFYFASVVPTLTDKGLAGLWGKCWHQVFRFGMSEPARPVLKFFRINAKSQLGRSIQVFVAFSVSGTIHMCASYTTFSIMPSKPYMPFLFFVSQAVGITLETAFSDFVTKSLKLNSPKILRQISNVAFVFAWGYLTGPMLADDFARCGVWLFEPLPISFARGVTQGQWWMWGRLGDWVGIWKGVEGRRAWYDRGIAIR